MGKRNQSGEKLRVGKYLVSSGVNGPGRRFVIWFQGCPFRCPECFNREFWSRKAGALLTIGELRVLIDSAQGIEGVTFTGGEPLIQSRNLLPLAEWMRSKGLSMLYYTGYRFQEILDGRVPYGRELLTFLDVLIDGRYQKGNKAALLWRGSRNQKVYFLTKRYRNWEAAAVEEGKREVELQVGQDDMLMTGIFDLALWKKLREKVTCEDRK